MQKITTGVVIINKMAAPPAIPKIVILSETSIEINNAATILTNLVVLLFEYGNMLDRIFIKKIQSLKQKIN